MNMEQFLTDFHFIRPRFLWFFVLLALSLILLIIRTKSKSKWENEIHEELRPYVLLDYEKGRTDFRPLLLFFTASFLILTAAGPSWNKSMAPRKEWRSNLVILLDTSQSMMAEDVSPNRLERAKFKIEDLLNQNPALPAALAAYAGTSHRVLPPTRDYGLIVKYLEPLSPAMMPAGGSRLDRALEQATLYDGESNYTAVLVMSDSPRDTDIEFIRAMMEEKSGEMELFYMPFATAQGFELLDSRGRLLLKDGDPVVSSRNDLVLNRIDAIEGVEVVTPVLDNTDVIYLSEKFKNRLTFLENREEEEESWEDYGPWFLIPAILFSLLWFRKGFRLLSPSLLTLLSILSLTSCTDAFSPADLWTSPDNRGDRAYAAGDFERAVELYDSSIKRGNAYYRLAEYELALDAYSSDNSPESLYNSALALINLGQYGRALEFLKQARNFNAALPEIDSQIEQLESYLVEYSEPVVEEREDKEDETSPAEDDNNDEKNSGDKDDRESDTVESDVRQADESDLPDTDEPSPEEQDPSTKYLIRAISPEPEEFLRRKFLYQLREQYEELPAEEEPW